MLWAQTSRNSLNNRSQKGVVSSMIVSLRPSCPATGKHKITQPICSLPREPRKPNYGILVPLIYAPLLPLRTPLPAYCAWWL